MDPLNKASRDADNLARSPGRQARQMQGQARRMVNSPVNQARAAKMKAQRLQRMPQQKLMRTKNQILRPLQSIGRSMGMAGAGVAGAAAGARGARQYRRKADRMTGTDFTVSAMLYPFGMIMAFIAGMMADWDTAYIHYHLMHARVLSIIAWVLTLICIPAMIVLLIIDLPILALIPLVILFLYWMYNWYLGFQAYSSRFVIVPGITGYLERSGKINFDTLEQVFSDEQ